MGSSAVEGGGRHRRGGPNGGPKPRANNASNTAKPQAEHRNPARPHRKRPQPQRNQKKSPSHGRAKESPRYINQTSRVRENRRPWGCARAHARQQQMACPGSLDTTILGFVDSAVNTF